MFFSIHAAHYCLILWPEENLHSIVPVSKILSPLEELVPEAMCRIKGWEKYISQVVAIGTKTEMDKTFEEIGDAGAGDGSEDGTRDD